MVVQVIVVLRRTVCDDINVITNSPSQDYTHPDGHNSPTYNMTSREFKPFTTPVTF